jgi:hypothetical protein
MRLKRFALLFLATSSLAVAEPTPKEQLLKPPQTARHYTISSPAAKHGDIWSWKTDNGELAYRIAALAPDPAVRHFLLARMTLGIGGHLRIVGLGK